MIDTTDPPHPDAPGDDADAALSGDLGTVTDDEWIIAHDRLTAELAGTVPPEQLAYTWAPGEPGGPPVDVDPHEAAAAPAPGRYSPTDVDERLEGGGFRG